MTVHEAFYDEATGGVVVSEVSPEEFELGEMQGPQLLTAAHRRALASWAEDIQSVGSRSKQQLWNRDKYVTPATIYEQMAVAYQALDDDVVSNVAEMSEALAFQKVSFEADDKDMEDVWNQYGRDVNLDAWLRTAWRELFTVSQFYGIRVWGSRNYRVRGKRENRRARKSYNMWVPVQLGFLDPTRVVPVQADLFGNTQFAWIASRSDLDLWNKVEREGTQYDELVSQLFLGPYQPSPKEAKDLDALGAPTDALLLLNPENVFRHTATKSPFERWAKVRMKSIFPLLDLKNQLREMDRAFLLGGINFILLITRGTDQRPASASEVTSTQDQVRSQSRSPIIVTDHRVNIEIITPDLSNVLNEDKWDVLDKRILSSLWGMFAMGDTNRQDTALTIGRVVSRGLSSRRHMLRRTIEKEIIQATVDHPLNGDIDIDYPSLEFAPRRIELEFDAVITTVLQELRDRGDISRETILNELGFDQDLEAMRREHEDKEYKEIFTPVNVPFDSPDKTTPGGAGRKGTRPGEDTNGGK